MGPVLVKQELGEAKINVEKRVEYIQAELWVWGLEGGEKCNEAGEREWVGQSKGRVGWIFEGETMQKQRLV